MINEQSPYYYNKEIFVRYSEMDYHKMLKPSAFLNFLQDVATVAADKAHFGYNEVYPKNLGWFLLKYHMEFNNYPQNIENLLIKTEARGYNKLFAHRDFDIYNNENKELIGRVISYWTLVNLADKSMHSPGEIFPDRFPKVEKREDDLSFLKVHPLERIDYSQEFKVRFDDIDVNKHVNNMNYIVWAFEALPKEFRDTYKLKVLDMVYKKEIQYGNTVLSEVQIDENIIKISVKNKNTDDELCVIEAEFEKF
ncbi:hypothetical protein IKE67_06575 [bacterium]|nr:hypothetical protein [bacterium]